MAILPSDKQSNEAANTTARINQVQKELQNEAPQGNTKRMLKQSVAPFILGGVATAAAAYFMKGERRAQLQAGLVNAKTQATNMASQATSMAQKSPIAKKIKENLDNETPIAEAIKQTLSKEEGTQNDNQQEKNQNQNQNQNQKNKQNNTQPTGQQKSQNKQSSDNQSKNSETGGF